MRVRIARVDRSLPLPQYKSEGAAGFDFICRLPFTVDPGAVARLPANVIVAVPAGYTLLIVFRSSTPLRHGLIAPNGIGVIDPDFQGKDDEIQIEVYNPTAQPIAIERGARIAQGLLVPVLRAEWEEIAETSGQSRGGFGSTGH